MTTFQNASGTFFDIADTGSVVRVISPYIKSVDGLPGARGLDDATAFGDTGRKWNPGIQDVPFTINMMWSKDALVGPDTVFGPLLTHTSAEAFRYGPEGSGGGSVLYSGACFVENYVTPSRVGSLVEAIASCRVNGVVTRGTF